MSWWNRVVRNCVLSALPAAALVLWILPAVAAPLGAATDELPEYAVKAAFLYHFAQFVEWPDDAARGNKPLTIGVLGKDPFGDTLDRAVLGKTIDGRGLVVRRFATAEDLTPCDILFVSSSEASRFAAVLELLKQAPVLTVGEDHFASRGGMIAFFFEDGRVRLEVNVGATQAANLRVSSKLLSVARLVKPAGQGGR